MSFRIVSLPFVCLALKSAFLYSLAIVQMQCSIIWRWFACSQTLGKVIKLNNVLLEELLQWPVWKWKEIKRLARGCNDINSFYYSHFGRLGGATSALVPAQMMTGGKEHMAIRALHGTTAKRATERGLVELVERVEGTLHLRLVAPLLDATSATYVLLEKPLVEVGLAAVGALVDRSRCSVHALHVRL